MSPPPSRLAEDKLERKLPDVNFRVGLALADWRPRTPQEKALEFFNFDFEFGDEPADASLVGNYEVGIGLSVYNSTNRVTFLCL